MQNAKCKMQNTKRKMQNAKRKMQNAKRKTQNAKMQKRKTQTHSCRRAGKLSLIPMVNPIYCLVTQGAKSSSATVATDAFLMTMYRTCKLNLRVFRQSLTLGKLIFCSFLFCPGACFIKLFTAVIYSFCNKPECLSLPSIATLV